MYITDTRPVKVNGFVVPYDHDDRSHTLSGDRRDLASPIICRMDNGAVSKLLQGALRGHGNYTRVHGNQGLMESLRSGDRGRMRLWREPWENTVDPDAPAPHDIPSGETVYKPGFPPEFEEAARTGHGGGDFFTSFHFAEAIRTGQQPFLDVHRGVCMSIVGILAWRSALQDSAPLEASQTTIEHAYCIDYDHCEHVLIRGNVASRCLTSETRRRAAATRTTTGLRTPSGRALCRQT